MRKPRSGHFDTVVEDVCEHPSVHAVGPAGGCYRDSPRTPVPDGNAQEGHSANACVCSGQIRIGNEEVPVWIVKARCLRPTLLE